MKIRSGFVSNSSSSSFYAPASFCVPISKLTEEEINLLLNYGKLNDDGWFIEQDKYRDMIEGSSIMDNGKIHDWIEKVNIDKKLFLWGN